MNGSTQPLALLTNTPHVTFADLLPVVAAIQRQLDEHLLPEWSAHGSITAWDNPNTVPKDYAPIFVCDTITGADPRLAGFHTTKDQRPYANVLYNLSGDWTIDVSHEALEIVLDPLGQTMQKGPSPDPTQGQVDFLLEICDPCGRGSFYWIDDVRVADFYRKNYFDTTSTPGTFYSKNEKLDSPFQILSGGYLTWRDSTGQWWEQDFFNTLQPPTRITPPNIGASLREQIDMATAHKRFAFSNKASKRRLRTSIKEARSRKAAANRIRTHSTWLERQLKAFDASIP
jgi:hypothetical protein